MSKLPLLTVTAAILLIGACVKAPTEPTRDDLMSAVAECTGNACKDLQKTSCKTAGDPDGMNGVFKCKFSYVLKADASNSAKTAERCFIKDPQWREAAGC